MANIQISVYIPEEWVEAADLVAAKESRTRNFILSRWLENGRALETGGRWRLVDTEAAKEIDTSDIPERLDWSGAVRGKYYRGDRDKENQKNSEVLGTGVGGAELGVVPGIRELQAGMEAVREIEAKGKLGLPGPDFGGDYEFSGSVVRSQPIPPKVSDEAIAFGKALYDAADRATGADPRIVQGAEKQGARTAAGVEQKLDVQKVAAKISKKIAKVAAPVPDPGSDHDPKTCRMYGCLRCKLAKGEK